MIKKILGKLGYELIPLRLHTLFSAPDEAFEHLKVDEYAAAEELFISRFAVRWEAFYKASYAPTDELTHPDSSEHCYQVALHLRHLAAERGDQNAIDKADLFEPGQTAPQVVLMADDEKMIVAMIDNRRVWQVLYRLADSYKDNHQLAEKRNHLFGAGYHLCALAAKNGQKPGMWDYAVVHLQGIGGVAKDSHEALKWLTPLEGISSPVSLDTAKAYAELNDVLQQKFYLEQAIALAKPGDEDNTYVEARIILAKLYLAGRPGIGIDIEKAILLLEEVLEQTENKNMGAAVLLAVLYQAFSEKSGVALFNGVSATMQRTIRRSFDPKAEDLSSVRQIKLELIEAFEALSSAYAYSTVLAAWQREYTHEDIYNKGEDTPLLMAGKARLYS